MENKKIENIQYAGFWRRFLASAVDNLILSLIGLGISLTLGSDPFPSSAAKNNLELFDIALSTVVFILYSLLFWVNYDGSTPGKKLLAIKIVHSEGKPLNYGISFIRYLGYFVSLIPLGLGYIWVAFDSKKQGWHDKIAGTYVIKTDKTPRTGLAIVLLILLVITIIIYTAIGISTDPDVQKAFSGKPKTDLQKINTVVGQKEKENIQTYVPTSCGLSIPLPNTTDTYKEKSRKWVYDEVTIDPQGFDILDKDVLPVKSLNANYLDYRDPQDNLANSQGIISVSAGLVIFCADNTKSLTLDEYKSLALANKTYKVTIIKEKVIYGDVETVSIIKAGKNPRTGTILNEPAFLAVNKDATKLLYIRIWGFKDKDDPMADKILNDVIDLIFKYLKYR